MNKEEIQKQIEDILQKTDKTFPYNFARQSAIQAFNLALELAAENVEITTIGRGFEAEDVVDKESILKLKL